MATTKTTTKAAAKTPAKASTEVAVKKTGTVISIKDAMAAQVAALAGKIQPATGLTIRITQDKKFILPDGSETREPLELVIVDFVSKNTFYEGAYDRDNISPPTCFAISETPQNMAPSPNSPVIQSESGCASCPMNQFGSADNGKGKACKNMRSLAVLPPDADADTPIWLLNVSPTAVRAWDGYVAGVARTFGSIPIGVVTTVSFNEASEYPQLVFSDPQQNTNIEAHWARMEEAKELLTKEPDVSSYGQEAAKPKGAGAKRAPARPAARQPMRAAGGRR